MYKGCALAGDGDKVLATAVQNSGLHDVFHIAPEVVNLRNVGLFQFESVGYRTAHFKRRMKHSVLLYLLHLILEAVVIN